MNRGNQSNGFFGQIKYIYMYKPHEMDQILHDDCKQVSAFIENLLNIHAHEILIGS